MTPIEGRAPGVSMRISHRITTETSIEIEHLDPCPFCQDPEAQSLITENGGFSHIWCRRCGCKGAFGMDAEKAIKQWNKPRTMENHQNVWAGIE
jgi:hypothetical protein